MSHLCCRQKKSREVYTVEEEVKCACVIQSCPGELVELACSVLVHSEADCASRQI